MPWFYALWHSNRPTLLGSVCWIPFLIVLRPWLRFGPRVGPRFSLTAPVCGSPYRLAVSGDSEASACGKLEKGRTDEETRFVQVADAIDPKYLVHPAPCLHALQA